MVTSDLLEARRDWALKNLPKTRLKDTNKGQACCEWPGHQDSSPSMIFDLETGVCTCRRCNHSMRLSSYAATTDKPTFPMPEATVWESLPDERQSYPPYTTADGKPVLRVTRIRKDGKKAYPQERWDGQRWTPGGLQGRTRPLFNAPALAAADSGSLVFIVEGEKCAVHLQHRDLLATTAPEGAGKFNQVAPEYLELLLPLGPIILPDNDENGTKHAIQVAEILAKLGIDAKILVLPGLGPKGDVADYLVAPKTRRDLLDLVPSAMPLEEFRARANPLVEVTEPATLAWAKPLVAAVEPEAPIPLDPTPRKPEAPVKALPEFLRQLVSAVAEANQVPASYPISLVLGALSTATLKRVVVDAGRGPVTPLNEWFLTSLESGSGKSSSLRTVFGPIYGYERQLVNRDRPEEGENLIGVISSDPTPEALEKRLRANDGRFSIANPEAADLFAVLAGKYTANGSGANIGLFLKSYSGDSHRSDRVLRGATYIDQPLTTLTLSLQPSAFDRVCCEGEFRERGMMARFLMDAPDSLLGYRNVVDPEPVSATVRNRWQALLNSLLSIQPPRDESGELQPHRIPVTPQAVTLLRNFRVWAEKQLRPDGYFECCREFGARAAEHVVKLAGLLHCAEHPVKPWETAVKDYVMQAAIEIFGYYAEHARLASTSGDERKKNGRLLYLLDRIRSKPEWKTSFKARDLFLLVKKTRGFETMEALSNDLNRLVEFGYLSEVPTTARKGRPSISYQVHSLENHPQNPQKPVEPYGKGVFSEGQATLKTDFSTLNNTSPTLDQAAEVDKVGNLF